MSQISIVNFNEQCKGNHMIAKYMIVLILVKIYGMIGKYIEEERRPYFNDRR